MPGRCRPGAASSEVDARLAAAGSPDQRRLQTLNEQLLDRQSELNVQELPLLSSLRLLDLDLQTLNEQLLDMQSELNVQELPLLSSLRLLDLDLQTLNEQLRDSQSELNVHFIPLPSDLSAYAGPANEATTSEINTNQRMFNMLFPPTVGWPVYHGSRIGCGQAISRCSGWRPVLDRVVHRLADEARDDGGGKVRSEATGALVYNEVTPCVRRDASKEAPSTAISP